MHCTCRQLWSRSCYLFHDILSVCFEGDIYWVTQTLNFFKGIPTLSFLTYLSCYHQCMLWFIQSYEKKWYINFRSVLTRAWIANCEGHSFQGYCLPQNALKYRGSKDKSEGTRSHGLSGSRLIQALVSPVFDSWFLTIFSMNLMFSTEPVTNLDVHPVTSKLYIMTIMNGTRAVTTYSLEIMFLISKN